MREILAQEISFFIFTLDQSLHSALIFLQFMVHLDINLIKNEIVPLFKALANDDQDSVRLLTVGACVEIAKILSNEDIQEHVRRHISRIISNTSKALADAYVFV